MLLQAVYNTVLTCNPTSSVCLVIHLRCSSWPSLPFNSISLPRLCIVASRGPVLTASVYSQAQVGSWSNVHPSVVLHKKLPEAQCKRTYWNLITTHTSCHRQLMLMSASLADMLCLDESLGLAVTWLSCYQLLQLLVEIVILPCLALDLICSPLELQLTLGNGRVL